MGRPFPAPSRALPPPAPRPWVLHEQGNANEFCLLAPDGKDWILGLLHNGAPLAAQQEANLRFLVLAVNNHDALVEQLRIMTRNLRAHMEADRQREGLLLEHVCPCLPELLAAEALIKKVAQ